MATNPCRQAAGVVAAVMDGVELEGACAMYEVDDWTATLAAVHADGALTAAFADELFEKLDSQWRSIEPLYDSDAAWAAFSAALHVGGPQALIAAYNVTTGDLTRLIRHWQSRGLDPSDITEEHDLSTLRMAPTHASLRNFSGPRDA